MQRCCQPIPPRCGATAEVPAPCDARCCSQTGFLEFCTEFIFVSSICSYMTFCPHAAAIREHWKCFNSTGVKSHFSELQVVQCTLKADFPSASLIRVTKRHNELEQYDSFCVFLEGQQLGPFAFGTGFQIPPVCAQKPVLAVVIPCSQGSEPLAFCEHFAATLSVDVRLPILPTSDDHTLYICDSIPWDCAFSDATWDHALHRATIGSAPFSRPQWKVVPSAQGPRAAYYGSLVGLASLSGLTKGPSQNNKTGTRLPSEKSAAAT